jgi:hypothetical protein
MTDINEKEIRERLERAVAPLDPVAPPLDLLRERAVKLRRFRISAGGGLLAAAAAAVTVAVVVVPANGSQSVRTAAPSAASLTKYAAAHGGKHVAGPIGSGPYYGAFADKQGIEVVKYAGGAWHADGAPITKYGPGRFVIRIADGGDIVPGSPSFVERYQGGDVSYFGGVVYNDHGTWTAARFGKCSGYKALSCAYAGTSEPYGHVAMGSFVSDHNNCTPNCAAGKTYVVTWKWNATSSKFVVTNVTRYRVYHAG